MQIVQPDFIGKSNAVSAAVRKTSCNRGWLQVFIHTICGTFTVTSFILIVLIALQIFPSRNNNTAEPRCRISNCRVICTEAPNNDEFEDDIVYAVMEAESQCNSIFLRLDNPIFTNGAMPLHWLPRLRPNVYELYINGGNLQDIPRDVFTTPFARNLKILYLENITISSWSPYMLVGLSNLQQLVIKNCNLISIKSNALVGVSQTLEALTITGSGRWDPVSITGTTKNLVKLANVDMSSNDFGNILQRKSFSMLHYCKSLELSYNKITYIGAGTFDRLHSIQSLYLNNNLLVSVVSGLFDKITTNVLPRPQLNLENNLWHCDCSSDELRELSRKDALIVDPICVTPHELRGKTFTEYDLYCKRKNIRKNSLTLRIQSNEYTIDEPDVKMDCQDVSQQPVIFTSPFRSHQCPTAELNVTRTHLDSRVSFGDLYEDLNNFWIKPSLFIKGVNFTMVELCSSASEGYGLIWYKTECPDEVFCVSVLPEVIRLYDVNISSLYTFCPLALNFGIVESEKCVGYSAGVEVKPLDRLKSFKQVFMYMIIAISCLFFGALCVYALVRKYPLLLKGSKRVLFVKHKTVDALVLPPKINLNSRNIETPSIKLNDNNMIQVPERNKFKIGQLVRTNSVRSNISYAPSYISALQPTDEQLADWRLKHGDDKLDTNYATISSISSEVPHVSWLCGNDNSYYSLDYSYSLSESLKST